MCTSTPQRIFAPPWHLRILAGLFPFLLGLPASAQTVIRVPQDVANLATAILTVPDGGIIEMATGSYAPPSGGFLINDASRSFTIRAAEGADVALDGGGTERLLRVNNAPSVTFEGLTFRNGFSTAVARSGGVTLNNTTATFVDCRFEDNVSTTGGGGAVQTSAAEAFFVDCVWDGNSSLRFGGAMAVFESTAWVHDSQVLANRTNLPGHVNTATGGGFTVTARTDPGAPPAKLRASNTRFQDNQTGFAGGALMGSTQWLDPVTTPHSEMLVANCTFENNVAEPDPAVTPNGPTAGGAIHSENQTTTRVFNSRFLENRAQTGGAVNLYRAVTEVHSSVLRGNRATGVTSGGFGGSFQAGSNDTGNDGADNRRSATLTVTDSLVQCQYDTVTGAVARLGGAVSASGDLNRNYGLNGNVPAAGSSAVNRASVTLDGVAVYDCETSALGGGGVATDLVALDILDSLIMAATASTSQGGGLRLASETAATVDNTTLAKNSASNSQGGAIFLAGSSLDLSDSELVENDSSQAGSGSAILANAQADAFGLGFDFDVTGTVSSSTLSNNTGGRPLQEIDNDSGPINDLRYNGNSFHSPSTDVYLNSLTSTQNAAGLNGLTVVRSGATNTDKSQVDNVDLGSAPVVGRILSVPSQILPVTAAGDAASETESFLTYAWSGGSATVSGGPVNGNAGIVSAGVGTHTLSVAGSPFMTEITQGPAPAAAFNSTWNGGQSFTLSWNTTAGTFLDMAIDQGVVVTAAAAGSVMVTPPALPATYRLFVLTEEGGVVKELQVDIDLIFADGFESGNATQWSNSIP